MRRFTTWKLVACNAQVTTNIKCIIVTVEARIPTTMASSRYVARNHGIQIEKFVTRA